MTSKKEIQVNIISNKSNTIFLISNISIFLALVLYRCFSEPFIDVDFRAYWWGTKAFLYDLPSLYSIDYYIQNSAPIFIYLPLTCYFFIPLIFLEYNIAIWIWVYVNISIGIINIILLSKLMKQYITEKKIYFIAMLLYSICILHYWNIGILQRAEIIIFLLLLIFREKKINLKSIIYFTLLVSFLPYLILIYSIILLRDFMDCKKIKHIFIAIIIFCISNFQLFFILPQFINTVFRFSSLDLISKTFDSFQFEYSIIGIAIIFYHNITNSIDFTLIIILGFGCLILSSIFILIKSKNKDWLDLFSLFFISNALFNPTVHYIHILFFFPFILLYLLNKNIQYGIGLFFFAIPIPFFAFQLVHLIELVEYKRIIGYILLLMVFTYQTLKEFLIKKRK